MKIHYQKFLRHIIPRRQFLGTTILANENFLHYLLRMKKIVGVKSSRLYSSGETLTLLHMQFEFISVLGN